MPILWWHDLRKTQMSDFVLTAPAPVAAVSADAAAGLVPIDDAARMVLDEKVDRYLADLLAIDARSPEFGRKAAQLANIGQREVAAVADQAGRLVGRPDAATDQGGVGETLLRLRAIVEDLDPGRDGGLLAPRRLLGIIPLGSKLKPYFERYAGAQTDIDAILRALARGKDELLRDNIALDGERRALWGMMGRLEEMVYLSRSLDTRLERHAAAIEGHDPAGANAVREAPLFHVRQRSTDLLTQMAIAVQGYLALDLIRKNNIELIKGVDRASTTTVAALRIAVTVAQALASQKLVLDRITALNADTSSVIARTSDLLSEQGGRIQQQAASATVQVETLQRAFADIYATMDAVDDFKRQALVSLKQTVDGLAAETDRARRHAGGAAAAAPSDSALGPV